MVGFVGKTYHPRLFKYLRLWLPWAGPQTRCPPISVFPTNASHLPAQPLTRIIMSIEVSFSLPSRFLVPSLVPSPFRPANDVFQTRNFINGEFTSSALGQTFALFNPATELKVADIEIASKADVDRAVSAAKAAQPAWAKLSSSARAACLSKLADLIEQPEHAQRLKEVSRDFPAPSCRTDAAALGQLDSMAMGRPVGGQGMDIAISAGRLRFDASLAHTLVGESSLLTPGALNLVLRQPYGVTAAIIPWNVSIM